MICRGSRLMVIMIGGSLLVSTGLCRQGASLLRVRKAVRLFGATPSPAGSAVLAYAQTEESPGEFTEGAPVLLQLDPQPTARSLDAPPSLDDPCSTAWSPDGSEVYFITESGIQSFGLHSGQIVQQFEGVFAGLALSSDGSRLATWNLKGPDTDHHSYSLTVYDLGSKKVVRSWVLPLQYTGDQYGHEIAFFDGDREVLARTYDMEGSTPLKRFQLSTGAVGIISSNAWSFVTAGSNAYIFEERKAGFTLMMLRQGAEGPELIASDVPFNSFAPSANPDILAAENLRTGAIALYRTQPGRFERIGSGCTAAVPLADGRIVYISGNAVVASPAGCARQASQQ